MCIHAAQSHDFQDEEAELLAELERIKAERAEKEAKEQAAAAEEAASAQQKELLSGNPLLRAGVRHNSSLRAVCVNTFNDTGAVVSGQAEVGRRRGV